MDKISWEWASKEYIENYDILLISKSDLSKESLHNIGSHFNYHQNLKLELEKLGFVVRPINSFENLQNEIRKRTFVYGIHSHSWFNGKELFTSAIAEYLGAPYLGPKPTVRALTEDKKLSKLLAESLDIKVPRFVEIKQGIIPQETLTIAPPWILKPRNGIASQFLFYCSSIEELRRSVSSIPPEILASTNFLIEEFIPGINLTVPIIDGISKEQKELIVYKEEDRNRHNLLSHKGKRGETSGYFSELYTGLFFEKAVMYSEALLQVIEDIDYGRFDFRCNPESGDIYFLETNVICNMSQNSVIGKLAKEYGASYGTLIEHVISHSISRQTKHI